MALLIRVESKQDAINYFVDNALLTSYYPSPNFFIFFIIIKREVNFEKQNNPPMDIYNSLKLLTIIIAVVVNIRDGTKQGNVQYFVDNALPMVILTIFIFAKVIISLKKNSSDNLENS